MCPMSIIEEENSEKTRRKYMYALVALRRINAAWHQVVKAADLAPEHIITGCDLVDL